MDGAAGCELLEESLEKGSHVNVTVSRCEYRCCGGWWGVREYETTYKGRVLSLNVEEFLLTVLPELGKSAEVIAKYSDLLAVEPVVD